jgi:hypothetical protein
MDCSRSRDAKAVDDFMYVLPSGERLLASRSAERSRAGGSRVKRTLDGEHQERRLGRTGEEDLRIEAGDRQAGERP